MFSGIFKRKQARFFLGSLVVAARGEMKRSDEWGVFQFYDLQAEIKQKLTGVITLQPVSDVQDLRDSDLVLDVDVVCSY